MLRQFIFILFCLWHYILLDTIPLIALDFSCGGLSSLRWITHPLISILLQCSYSFHEMTIYSQNSSISAHWNKYNLFVMILSLTHTIQVWAFRHLNIVIILGFSLPVSCIFWSLTIVLINKNSSWHTYTHFQFTWCHISECRKISFLKLMILWNNWSFKKMYEKFPIHVFRKCTNLGSNAI